MKAQAPLDSLQSLSPVNRQISSDLRDTGSEFLNLPHTGKDVAMFLPELFKGEICIRNHLEAQVAGIQVVTQDSVQKLKLKFWS